MIFKFVFLLPMAMAHPGETLRSGQFAGCHTQGSDRQFHCHSKSKYPGRSWPSEAEAIAEVGGAGETKSPAASPELTGGNGSGTGATGNAEKYDRGTWGSWDDPESDCRSTRTEILARDDMSERPSADGCEIKTGRWTDFYTGEIITSPDLIDVDHVVSLKHAHEMGASRWTASKKRKFYNDPDNLVVTHRSVNRSKGAHDFLSWLPSDRRRACDYAVRWFKVKRKYGLRFSDLEYRNFRNLGCH